MEEVEESKSFELLEAIIEKHQNQCVKPGWPQPRFCNTCAPLRFKSRVQADPLDPTKIFAIVPRGASDVNSGPLRMEKSDGSVVVLDENFQVPSDWYRIVEEPIEEPI